MFERSTLQVLRRSVRSCWCSWSLVVDFWRRVLSSSDWRESFRDQRERVGVDIGAVGEVEREGGVRT